jgi:alpha-mannosidase
MATSEPDPAIGAGEVKGQSYPEVAFHAIDTRHFYAQVRKDCGVITTLFDKRVGRELVGYASARAAGVPEQVRPDLAVGVLQVLHEHPHTMSSWVIDDVYEETSLIRGASADIVEDGPVRLVVKTTHSYRSSTITSRVIFYADLPRIDFVIDSRWEELGGPEVGVPNLVLSFGSRLDGAEAWYETPFAAAHRPSDGLVVPALRWADMGDDEYGLALLNDGKYGHDALGTRLRVHLVRGSYEPDPTPEVGRDDHACFTLLPHSGSWVDAGVVSAAAALNQPLAVRPARAAGARSGRAIPFRPELIGAATAAIASLRMAADGRGPVVTAYETAGRPDVAELVGLPPHATVWDVSATDDRRTAQIADPSGILRVAFRPFQVRHLLIEHAELFQNDPSSPEIASATTANGEIQP